MRKATLLLLAATTSSLSTRAQPSKWFVSVSSGVPFSGPVQSIKRKMVKNGLNQNSTFNFLFLYFEKEYLRSIQNPPLMFKFGKRITAKRSLYVIAGISNTGEAVGNKMLGVDEISSPFLEMDNPFLGYSVNLKVNLRYKLFQAGAGYQYSYHNTRSKVAMAPSVFLFKYENTSGIEAQRHTAVVPGIAFSGRVPLEKKSVYLV